MKVLLFGAVIGRCVAFKYKEYGLYFVLVECMDMNKKSKKCRTVIFGVSPIPHVARRYLPL